MYDKFVRAIRNLAADTSGTNFRYMHSIETRESIERLFLLLSKSIDRAQMQNLTDAGFGGMHAFILGVDGFVPPMNWYLG